MLGAHLVMMNSGGNFLSKKKQLAAQSFGIFKTTKIPSDL